MNIYNGNLNKFCIVRLLLEIKESGIVHIIELIFIKNLHRSNSNIFVFLCHQIVLVSYNNILFLLFISFNNDSYNTGKDFGFLVLELITLLILVGFIMIEVGELKAQGIKLYLLDKWNYLELSSYLVRHRNYNIDNIRL
jgi:hypothetical protein